MSARQWVVRLGLTRIWAMMVKELWAVLRDPKGRIILVVPPVLQLVLFASAATLEVRNVTLGVLDHDGGAAASEVISQLAGSPNVARLVPLRSEAEMARAINRQQVIGALIVPQGFSADVAAHRPARLGAVLDGRRSNAAQIVESYLEAVAASAGATLRQDLAQAQAGGTITRAMFNPNLDFLLYILPTLVVTVASVSALSVTGQSVARERELGSFDQLMVSPLRLHEILIGKMTPPLLVGTFNAAIYLAVIWLGFGEPLRGSVVMYFSSVLLFLAANAGIGMTVSALAHTQQQAFLGVFLVLVPMNMLSGFAAPVDNMPVFLQWMAQANPQMHMIVIMEGLFLKAMPVAEVLRACLPLVAIAAVTLTGATLLFRSRME